MRRQFREIPGIMEGTPRPDYAQCVDIVTGSAIKEMMLPAAIPIVIPIVVGDHQREGARRPPDRHDRDRHLPRDLHDLRRRRLGQRQEADRGRPHGGKGSDAHAAAITGDTVGDPYKDTAGPAINPMIKITNIVAILIIPIIVSIH